MSLLEAFLEAEMDESDLHAESEVREVWFAIRSDGATGRGTREDPYNGSEVIVYNPPPGYPRFEFDRLLRSVPENSVIHLGPGIFSTGGGDPGTRRRTPWSPKSGQKIVGSGIFQTTLKLVLWNDPDTNQANVIFPAIGINQAANFSSYEVSDLTIDCNLLGQPNTTDLGYPKITVSGIALYGTNIKVRRVRIINWGRRAATKECFPLYVSESMGSSVNPSGVPQYAAELMSNVVEDCVVEQPDWNIGDDRPNGGGAGRIVTEENVIELAPSVADATGIWIDGTAADAFNTFVARGNAIRPKDSDITTAQQRFGIKFTRCTNAIVTDNVIDLGKKDANNENPADNAVFQQNCGKVTTFNNRKANGEFLAASTGGAAPHVWELTDEAENAVLRV